MQVAIVHSSDNLSWKEKLHSIEEVYNEDRMELVDAEAHAKKELLVCTQDSSFPHKGITFSLFLSGCKSKVQQYKKTVEVKEESTQHKVVAHR
jgi:hypothetical protein